MENSHAETVTIPADFSIFQPPAGETNYQKFRQQVLKELHEDFNSILIGLRTNRPKAVLSFPASKNPFDEFKEAEFAELLKAKKVAQTFKAGDLVTRDGTDVHKIVEIDDDMGVFECVIEPEPYEDMEPWTKIGEREHNLSRRYKPLTKTQLSDKRVQALLEGRA